VAPSARSLRGGTSRDVGLHLPGWSPAAPFPQLPHFLPPTDPTIAVPPVPVDDFPPLLPSLPETASARSPPPVCGGNLDAHPYLPGANGGPGGAFLLGCSWMEP
jgi:hypothetical protein